MRIQTDLLTHITVARFHRMRPVVDLYPPYQREGNVWQPSTQRTLIDSILNGLDVPKLYFEVERSKRTGGDGRHYQYAVIDGKQRLETIISFLDGGLALDQAFILYEDREVEAGGLTMPELEERYSWLAQRFTDYVLPIVEVKTDSEDLIEEMFQRLNASTALNAAERRNALSGPTKDAANELAEHEFLTRNSPIKNARYKYKELGAKFLAIEHQLVTKNKIGDTKAETLYELFAATRGDNPSITEPEMTAFRDQAAETLDRMTGIFAEDDPLLRSIGTVVVYYIAFRDPDLLDLVDREKLAEFETLRRSASMMGEYDDGYARAANARLRQYNVYVQSTNDGTALAFRASALAAFLRGYQPDDPLAGLDDLVDGDLPDKDIAEE